MRVRVRIWIALVGIVLACVGSWGYIKLSEGGSLWWWIPVALLIGVLVFYIIQAVLWWLWERKN